MTKTDRALGDGATGDIDDPDGKGSTLQPGLKESDERPGKTPEEQAAAEARAAKKEQNDA